MKKLLLSGLIVGTFLFYSLQQRKDTTSNSLIAPSIAPSITQKTILQYKDGEYTGDAANAFYGNIQVKAIIQNGQISDVQFLKYPNDRQTSVEINTQAMPLLKSEAISAQSARVDIVSGATDSSQAFIQSLSAALAKAH
jgi:uncharacterized protein with FMN-binding domain